MQKYVIVSNTRARQALQVGPRVLASRSSGGKSSCRLPVEEFLSRPVQAAVTAGRLSVVGYSDPETEALCCGVAPEAVTEQVVTTPLVEEAVFVESPEAPVEEAAEDVAPPPAPEPESPAEGESTPEGDLSAYEATPAWTREALEALPYNGEGEGQTLVDLAHSLGIKGRKASAIIDAILAQQEGA